MCLDWEKCEGRVLKGDSGSVCWCLEEVSGVVPKFNRRTLSENPTCSGYHVVFDTALKACPWPLKEKTGKKEWDLVAAVHHSQTKPHIMPRWQ